MYFVAGYLNGWNYNVETQVCGNCSTYDDLVNENCTPNVGYGNPCLTNL